MAKTTWIPDISLSNDGNKLKITDKDGREEHVWVMEHIKDPRRGQGVRLRYSDGSVGTSFDKEMDGYKVEVVHA